MFAHYEVGLTETLYVISLQFTLLFFFFFYYFILFVCLFVYLNNCGCFLPDQKNTKMCLALLWQQTPTLH